MKNESCLKNSIFYLVLIGFYLFIEILSLTIMALDQEAAHRC